MRLQNYQRTFLRVNPSSASFSSFRFLRFFLSSFFATPDMEVSMNRWRIETGTIYPSIYLCDEIINEFVKGIIHRKIVVHDRIFVVSIFLLSALLIRVG